MIALLIIRPLDADRAGLGELLALGRLGALDGGLAVRDEDDIARAPDLTPIFLRFSPAATSSSVGTRQ